MPKSTEFTPNGEVVYEMVKAWGYRAGQVTNTYTQPARITAKRVSIRGRWQVWEIPSGRALVPSDNYHSHLIRYRKTGGEWVEVRNPTNQSDQ